MKGGYLNCNKIERGVWENYMDSEYKNFVKIEDSQDLVESINIHNKKNWKKITGTQKMPLMLNLALTSKTNVKNKKRRNFIENYAADKYIPEEFIIFYKCEYLKPLSDEQKDNMFNPNRGKKSLIARQNCKNLNGKSSNNKQSNLNNLPCIDPCRKYKKCYGYNCCNVIEQNKKKLVYCDDCIKLKNSYIAFNLFEIMRQILVAKCSLINNKNILPYILNPITQKPFTQDELNNFSTMFKESISLWKQNININKSIIRRNVMQLTENYTIVGPALTIIAEMLFPGGQFAALLGLMSTLIWTIGYIENIENVWELEKIAGNFKHYDKKYMKASSKVVLASVEAVLFSVINSTLAREGYNRYKALGNMRIKGPLLKNQLPKGISGNTLQYLNNISLFSFGIPVLKKVGLTGEVLYNQIKKIPLSGYGSLIYKADKLKKMQKGEIDINSFDYFDLKLNNIVIKEQELRAEQLRFNAGFLDDSTKDVLKVDFCNILSSTLKTFKKRVRVSKIDKTLAKTDKMLTPLQKATKNVIMTNRKINTRDASGGGFFYNKITNPLTGRKVSIYGKIGKQILRNYSNMLC